MTLILDPRTQDLLDIVQQHVDTADIEYAVGGAIAMAAHGYARHTNDVDLFVVEKDRHKVFRALRDAGMQISAVASPFHYIAVLPEHANPDIRIDLLFPAGDPELSAIELPQRKSLTRGGSPLNVFPADLLAIAKFYADRDEDESDLRAMYTRGIFDPVQVGDLIEREFDEDDAVDWKALMAKFAHRKPPRKKPTKRMRKGP